MTDLLAVVQDLRGQIDSAGEEAAESHREAMNSYGAGYDRGFLDGLRQALRTLLEDPS